MLTTKANVVLIGLILITPGCTQPLVTENPSKRYDLSKVPAPPLTDVSVVFEKRSALDMAEVDLGTPEGTSGEEDTVFVMRANGQDIRPLACVFVAAGASLAGAEMSVGQMENYVPLVSDGGIVVEYGSDGPVEPTDSNSAFVAAHDEFAKSMSGLDNARNATEFALANFNVDPERRYAVGHSSRAELALLLTCRGIRCDEDGRARNLTLQPAKVVHGA